MQKFEGQVETTADTLVEELARQPYVRPTVETLDVGMTLAKTVPTAESITTIGS